MPLLHDKRTQVSSRRNTWAWLLVASDSVILDAGNQRTSIGEWHLPSSMVPHALFAAGRTISVRDHTRTAVSGDMGDVMCE